MSANVCVCVCCHIVDFSSYMSEAQRQFWKENTINFHYHMCVCVNVYVRVCVCRHKANVAEFFLSYIFLVLRPVGRLGKMLSCVCVCVCVLVGDLY